MGEAILALSTSILKNISRFSLCSILIINNLRSISMINLLKAFGTMVGWFFANSAFVAFASVFVGFFINVGVYLSGHLLKLLGYY